MQLRPRALGRVLAYRDLPLGAARRWYHRLGRRVWSYKIRRFLLRDRGRRRGPTLAEFWGTPGALDY
jgi:anaerobic magnesium-protoporphyrin IX monomethyl ester cyclase